jgi:DNA mismatch repair protein MutS
VAKLAGVPDFVIKRAKMILEELDQADITKHAESIKVMEKPEKAEDIQLSLFENISEDVVEELKGLDVNALTPLEALNKLAQLKKRLNG